MSFLQAALYYVPTYLLGIIIVSISLAISTGGLFLIRSCVPIHKIKLHNEIAGFIFSTVGVIYAVLLAFMVIVAWQDFHQASSNVAMEASNISSVYRDCAVFSAPFKEKMFSALDDYITAIVKEEWPLIAKGEKSRHVQDLQENLWKIMAQYKPRTEAEKAFYTEAINKLNNAGELRRQRLVDSMVGIHPVLWFVLICGGILTILFTLFFGTENFGAQLLMTSILSTLIALILTTIMLMNYPYTGDIRISSDTFLRSLTHYAKIK